MKEKTGSQGRGLALREQIGEGISFFILFYYSHVHTRLGSFLLPAHTPSLTTHSAPPSPPTPSIPSRKYFALISNFVVERVYAIIGRNKGFC
jgi:hypothetical protein